MADTIYSLFEQAVNNYRTKPTIVESSRIPIGFTNMKGYMSYSKKEDQVSSLQPISVVYFRI